MRLTITHQETYSRGELILRTLFGWLYIAIPHGFVLIFLSIWSAILAFITFWACLFTGKFPRGIFDYQVNLMNWGLRVECSLYNLVDGYPPFGLKTEWEKTKLEVPYPESVGRGLVILRVLFGWLYVAIPHYFLLFFRMIWGSILMFLAWWALLFTGKYPEGWHAYQVGTIRWALRIGLYLGYFTDDYPPFNGREE